MAVEVATLIARLRAETSQFQRGLTEAQGRLDKTAKSGLSMGKAISTAGKVSAGVFLAIGVAAIHEADQFETAHSRMVVAMQNVGISYQKVQGQVDALKKHNESLGFSWAETEGSLSRAVTATGNMSKSLKIMAVAADLARARGMSLQDGVDLLNRVMAGNVRAIKMMGLNLDVVGGGLHAVHNAQSSLNKAQEKYKNLLATMGLKSAAAQQAALNALTKQSARNAHSNAAEAKRQQAAQDALNRAQAAYKTVLDAVGLKSKETTVDHDHIAAALARVQDAQKRLASVQGASAVTAVAGSSNAAAAALKNVTAQQRLKSAAEAVALAQAKLNQVSGQSNMVLGKIGSLMKGQAAGWAKTFPGQMKVLHARMVDLLTVIGQHLTPVIVAVVGWFTKHKMATVVLASALGALMALAVVAWFGQLAGSAIGAAGKVLTSAKEVVVAMRIWAAGQEMTAASAALSFGVILAGVAAVVFIGYLLVKHWHEFVAGLKKIWDFMANHWKVIVTVIAGVIFGPFGAAIAWMATHWSQTWHFLERVVGIVVASIVTVLRMWLDISLNVVGDILHALRTAAHWLSFGLADPLAGATKAFDDFHKSIDDSMTSFANDASHWGTNIGKNLATGISSAQGAVSKAANTVGGAAASNLRIHSPADEGPLSTLGGPEGWGRRLSTLYGKGMTDSLAGVRSAARVVAGSAVSGRPAAEGGARPGGGSVTYVSIVVEGSVTTKDKLIDEIRRGIYKDKRHNATVVMT